MSARHYPPAIDRVLDKCVVRDGCWIYTGKLTNHGRARLSDHGRKTYGHRLTYEFFIGPIPDGLTFDHLCRTPACVNPWHGDLVPIVVNVMRAIDSPTVLNRAKVYCLRGHLLAGRNLIPSGNGRRACRRCQTIRNSRSVECGACGRVLRLDSLRRHERSQHEMGVAA